MVTSADAERRVLEYLKGVTKGKHKDINLLHLRTDAICEGTKLKKEYVEEALQHLAGETQGIESARVPRIERVSSRFEIWIPIEREDLKRMLYGSDVAGYNRTFVAFVVTLIVYGITLTVINRENITLFTLWYLFGVVCVLLALPLAGFINSKFYKLNYRLQQVRHYKVYVVAFIVSVLIVVIVLVLGEQTTSRIILGAVGLIGTLVSIFGTLKGLTRT
jgi:hypothetical protein